MKYTAIHLKINDNSDALVSFPGQLQYFLKSLLDVISGIWPKESEHWHFQ